MKRSSFLKIGFLALAVTLILISLAGCVVHTADNSDRSPAKTPLEPAAYYLEKNVPEIIRVVAITYDPDGLDGGYGRALARAMEEISKDYEILETTPITRRAGYGSTTKELILRVKHK